MIVKDKGDWKQFITKNCFSKNLLPKNDRKLNTLLRVKYAVVKKLHLDKFFKEKSWFSMLDDDAQRLQSGNKSNAVEEQITLTASDLKLERLILYDLIPKEYIGDYKEKYLKYRGIIIKPHIGMRQECDILSQFDQMQLSRSVDSCYHIDNYPLKEESNLGKYFSYFRLDIIGISKSFFAIKYTLFVKPSINELLTSILENKVYKAADCVSNGKWWKKGAFAGIRCYDFNNAAKRQAITDYILELKSIIYGEIKSHLLTKFYNWTRIPSSIEIYSSETLQQKSKEILKVLFPYGNVSNFNKEHDLVFIPAQHIRGMRDDSNSSIIVADSSYFAKDMSYSYKIDRYDSLICDDYADYFIVDSLNQSITNNIYECQQELQKTISSKTKYKTLLSVKISTDRKLYYYKRLCNELGCMDAKKLKCKFAPYFNFFNDLGDEGDGFISPDDFYCLYDILFCSISDKNTVIKEMYKHFEENTKILESQSNYRIVKWTAIIAFVTLVVTIFFADNSYLWNQLIGLIKSLFKT